MGIRDSYSGLKEKMKLKLRGKKQKPDDAGTGTDGEGDDPAIPLPLPVYVVADGGHDRGGGEPNAGQHRARSADLLPRPDRPKSAPNDQEGREVDVDDKVGQGYLTLRRYDGVGVGSGSDQGGDSTGWEKVERVSPILRYSGKPDSVLTRLL